MRPNHVRFVAARIVARPITLLLLMGALQGSATSAAGQAEAFFKITVVDSETGRGVPLVELRTVNSIRYVTDSNGIIAFHEPGLMDQDVFFHIQSHGYEYPKNKFNDRGLALEVKRGGSATIKIKRLNIAERLYRVTGEGIYRDSVLVGHQVPLERSVLNGQVMGQDSVVATPYRGKIYWFWGDTLKPSFPLGNFAASGATSELPGQGGLDPGVGVNLTYFVDQTGFGKAMCPDFGPGLQWIESLMTLRDGHGRERLLARVASADGLVKTHDWHLAIFSDEKQIFESLVRWDIHDSHDVANPFRARVGTNEYIYLYPNYRVKADLQCVTNLAAYEAFTCLVAGSRFAGAGSRLNRAPEGTLRYEWQVGADRIDGPRQRDLIKRGALQPDEAWKQPHDIETGNPLLLDRGSVCWNEYRRRWVMITAGQPGEIWFCEADTPLGPWVYARRIVSHDRYNFYNPTQHRFFEQAGGALIYFEGTYTDSFSGAKEKTPRYDYNQIMYRLRLDDGRLGLPAPVYQVRQPDGARRWMLGGDVHLARAWERIETLPFFALPPERPPPGLIPIYQSVENGMILLQTALPARPIEQSPLFYALPATNSSASTRMELAREFDSSAVVPLYEYRHARNGARRYHPRPEIGETDMVRNSEPLCRVWRNPMKLLILDPEAIPVAPR